MGSSRQQVLVQSPDGEAEVFTTDVTEVVAAFADVDVLVVVTVFTVAAVVVVATTVVRSSSAEVKKHNTKETVNILTRILFAPNFCFVFEMVPR